MRTTTSVRRKTEKSGFPSSTLTKYEEINLEIRRLFVGSNVATFSLPRASPVNELISSCATSPVGLTGFCCN